MMAHILRLIPVVLMVAMSIGLSSVRSNPVAAQIVPLAQVASPTVLQTGFALDWNSIIGTMGVTGALVWYLWFTTAKSFPRVQAGFQAEMAEERRHHEMMVTRQGQQHELLVTKQC